MANPNPPTQKALEEMAAPFYRALGRAIGRWQHVEAGLFVLGHAIMKTEYRYFSLVFFHIKSADAKIQLIDRLCREKFSEPVIKQDWMPLLKDLDSGCKFRNGLAHFEVNFMNDPSLFEPGEPPIVITPHHLDVRGSKGPTVKGASTSLLNEAAEEYLLLSRRLIGFVQAHFSLEERRALNLPLQLQRFLEVPQTVPQAPPPPQPSSAPPLRRQARRKAEREARKRGQ